MTEEELAAVPPWEEYVCPIYNCLACSMETWRCLGTAMVAEGHSPICADAPDGWEVLLGNEGLCYRCPYHPDSPQVQELEAWRAANC